MARTRNRLDGDFQGDPKGDPKGEIKGFLEFPVQKK